MPVDGPRQSPLVARLVFTNCSHALTSATARVAGAVSREVPVERRLPSLSLRGMFDRIRFLAILSDAIAIGSMQVFSATIAFPLAAILFATSIVMALGTTDAAPAQPRAVIGGHLVATMVGDRSRDDCDAPYRHVPCAGWIAPLVVVNDRP
jgi:hypothetical protein